MSRPLAGTQYAGKMRPTVYMKVHDKNEVISKPAYSTLSATYDGTNGTTTYALAAAADFATGEYFTFSTPQRDFNISVGAVAVSGFKNIFIAAAGTTSYETIVAIRNAVSFFSEEIKFTLVSDTSFKLTALGGGLCAAGAIGPNCGMTIVDAPLISHGGTGDWAEIGELAEDLDDGGEMTTMKTASGKSFKTGETFNFKFGYINCNQTGKEAIESTFSGQDIDLVLWDKTDFKSLVTGYRGLPCNTMFKPIGDTVRINFDMTIEYAAKQLGTTKYMWTFEDETNA